MANPLVIGLVSLLFTSPACAETISDRDIRNGYTVGQSMGALKTACLFGGAGVIGNEYVESVVRGALTENTDIKLGLRKLIKNKYLSDHRDLSPLYTGVIEAYNPLN